MRMYGRKFVNRKLKRERRITSETRDAILWDVDWDNRIARVKIQGSNEYINVSFPTNEAIHPAWMKAGNAVRVIHRGGIRGNMEIIGHGQAIPTPLPGAQVHPLVSELTDMVLTGLEVLPTDPASMNVTITAGTYRIAGTEYDGVPGLAEAEVMSDTDPLLMSDAYPQATMGETTGDYPVMGVDDATMSDGFTVFTMGADADKLFAVRAGPEGTNPDYATIEVEPELSFTEMEVLREKLAPTGEPAPDAPDTPPEG